MRVAGEHVDGLDVVAVHFPLQHLALRVVEVALLDESVTLDNNELLELGVVPMLAFGDAGLGDIDANLAAIKCVHQLRKRTSVIDIHLQRECHLLFREI